MCYVDESDRIEDIEDMIAARKDLVNPKLIRVTTIEEEIKITKGDKNED